MASGGRPLCEQFMCAMVESAIDAVALTHRYRHKANGVGAACGSWSTIKEATGPAGPLFHV